MFKLKLEIKKKVRHFGLLKHVVYSNIFKLEINLDHMYYYSMGTAILFVF